MDGRKSYANLGWLLGGSGSALVLSALVACAAPAPEPSHGSSSAVTAKAFNRNNVIDDKSMRDATTVSADDLQAFLETTPWNTTSILATYTEDGKTAAQIMADTASAHGINPIEMITRVQMEQGLISKTTATASTIAIAFGCGCPDGGTCSDKYKGFAAQAECAAGTLRRAMDGAATSTGTVSGWAKSRSKDSLDGLTIVPANAATAALYTYTPWVGESGGGRTGVGGVSLHAQVWNRFAESLSYGATNTTQSAGSPSDADSGAAAPVTPPPAADAAAPSDPSDPSDPGDPTADASAPATGADAGAKGDGTPKAATPPKGPPADGSDDANIVGEGNVPPSSNAAPITSGKSTPTSPEELPNASDSDLAGKPKASAGCSTTGRGGQNGSNGSLIAGAAALAIVVARRRRR